MEIYLIRHPRPLRSEGLCYGRSEVAVDPDALAAVVASVRSRVPREELDAWASDVRAYRAGGGHGRGLELARDVPFGSVHRSDFRP
jgi:hypothetical protein